MCECCFAVRSMTPVQLEEKFRCCICLDIYTDPVSIPCGHNFCQDCIEDYWDTKEKADCPLCKETFSHRPPVRRNHEFADIIELLKRFALNIRSGIGIVSQKHNISVRINIYFKSIDLCYPRQTKRGMLAMLCCHQQPGSILYIQVQTLKKCPVIYVMGKSHYLSSRASSARRLTVKFT